MKGARAACALAALALAGGARGAPPGSPWGEGYFPNVELVTHDGRKVRFYDDLVRDRIVVVSFVFAHCTRRCGPMTANLARVQRRLGERVGRDVSFLTITMDPVRDTPEVLARYAQAYRALPGWTFLTGREEDVALLRRKFGDLSRMEDHASTISVGNDRTGQWWTTAALDDPGYLATLIGGWMDPSFTGAPGARSYARAPAVTRPGPGEKLYRERCAMCHVAGGDSVGPDLQGVAALRGREWLARWIAAPERLLAEKDPVAEAIVERHDGLLMPNMELRPSEVEAVVRFLEERLPPAPTTSRP